MRLLWVRVAAICLASAMAGAEPPQHYDSTIGYFNDGTQMTRILDARLAFELWIQEIAQNEKLHLAVNYYETPEATLKAFEAHAFDLFSINPWFYLREHRTVEPYSKAFWKIQIADTPYEEMLVVVRADSGIEGAGQLRGKRVATRENNYLGRLFFDRWMLESVRHGYAGYVLEMAETERYNTALLKTYFKNVEACILPAYAFEVAKEMNPSLSGSLKVIARSPQIFPPMIIVAHREMPDAMIAIYEHNAMNLDKTQRGRQILELYKFRRIMPMPVGEMKRLQSYYDEYCALKAKYGETHE